VRAAHSIKGSAANLGAVKVRWVAEALEHRARADGLADLGSLITELVSRYAAAEAELRKLIARHSGAS
jgi:HPt (histidine-containing phosphotransfer) domain-containing protein